VPRPALDKDGLVPKLIPSNADGLKIELPESMNKDKGPKTATFPSIRLLDGQGFQGTPPNLWMPFNATV